MNKKKELLEEMNYKKKELKKEKKFNIEIKPMKFKKYRGCKNE